MVLGTASTAAGLFFLSNPVAGLSLDQQYTLGSSLVGPGVPFIGVGIRALFQESVEETSWESYRAVSGRAMSGGVTPSRKRQRVLALLPESDHRA